MARYSAFRASDADREQVAERLRQAAAEGRLLAEELEQRLATALRARTYGELHSVVADLPRAPVARRSTSSLLTRAALGVAIVLAALVVVAVLAAVLAGLATVWLIGVVCLCAFRGRRAHTRAIRHRTQWQVTHHADRRAWL